MKVIQKLTFEFPKSGMFKMWFNDFDKINSGEIIEIPEEEYRSVARALTRVAMDMWHHIDVAYSEAEEKMNKPKKKTSKKQKTQDV